MGIENLGVQLNYDRAHGEPIEGKYKGKQLLICGSGWCIWDDLAQIQPGSFDIMAVNDIGMHLPYRIEHWYSNDKIMLPKWVAARRPRYKKDFEESIKTHSCVGGAKYTWPWPGHGTSSLNACYTGLALGYDLIVLAGIPLDDGGHYFDPPWVKTNFARECSERPEGPRFWRTAAKNVFDGKVKSLSGRTKDLLGSP